MQVKVVEVVVVVWWWVVVAALLVGAWGYVCVWVMGWGGGYLCGGFVACGGVGGLMLIVAQVGWVSSKLQTHLA